VCTWDALAADPAIAEPFAHVIAVDPYAHADADAVLAGLPAGAAGGFAHLAWGPAEVEFSLAVARAGLDLRPTLIGLYRALRDRAAAGPDLERVLRGDGPHPRPPEVAARMVRVLRDLGLVAYERDGAGHPACRVLDAPRTALEKSAAYRAYAARLADAERRLATAMPRRPEAQPATRPAVAGVG
jgi:single-stranded-DNA-specific exonuclease